MSPITSLFHHAASRSPAKIALITERSSLTYADLERDVSRLVSSLSKVGIKSGDHVGVLLPNCAEFVVLMLAAAHLGLVLIPQSMGLNTEAVARTFREADVMHVVVWHSLIRDVMTGFLPDRGTGKGVCISVGEARTGCATFADFLQERGGRNKVPSALSLDQPYLLVLTSGSTGEPKPIVLSQRTKVDRALSAADLYRLTDSDITLATTPLYHSLAQRLVLIPLLTGGTSVLMECFTPQSWIEAVKKNGITFSIAVSAQLQQLLQELRSNVRELPSLRCLVSSSALLDTDTKRELLAVLRCDFHECYGTSEIAIATNLCPQAAATKLGAVGAPIPGVMIRIIDEQGKPLPPDMPGEIVCKTPLRFSGYYKRPQITQSAMWGEYFRTGDVGRLDRDGYLYFLGRIKDIIITGGINVYPKDIEDVVAAHPHVRECAAIPVRHTGLGEVVGVVLAPRSLGEQINLREIQRLCALKLADFQQPHRYFVVDELPKNPMGKIDKRALTARYSTNA